MFIGRKDEKVFLPWNYFSVTEVGSLMERPRLKDVPSLPMTLLKARSAAALDREQGFRGEPAAEAGGSRNDQAT
jgi:hypothetical protein